MCQQRMRKKNINRTNVTGMDEWTMISFENTNTCMAFFLLSCACLVSSILWSCWILFFSLSFTFVCCPIFFFLPLFLSIFTAAKGISSFSICPFFSFLFSFFVSFYHTRVIPTVLFLFLERRESVWVIRCENER